MVSLRHSKVAIGDDNPDRQVSVTQWNAEHVLTGTAGTLLGFDGSGHDTEINPATLLVAAGGLTPEMFGAVGNGSTDDSAAFALLSAALNAQGGGTIEFTPGKTYMVG